MRNLAFMNPEFFLLFLFFIPVIAFYFSRRAHAALAFPSTQLFAGVKKSRWGFLRHLQFFLRLLALSFLIVAMARPQKGQDEGKRSSEGIDMMLVIDTSDSMQAMDFELAGERLDRLTVVKNVLAEFIANRPNDRLGLVVFGEKAYMQCPLTLDHDVLLKFLDRVKMGMAGGKGTAIGDGIATAMRRLKDIEAKSRVIILLTDGENNAGKVAPDTVAEAAKALGMTVYTIGAGTDGQAPFPVKSPFGTRYVYGQVHIDEELLTKIATTTGGQYFRATDTEALKKVYEKIDALEKTKIEVKEFKHGEDIYRSFLLPALGFVLLEMGLALTRWRRLPQ